MARGRLGYTCKRVPRKSRIFQVVAGTACVLAAGCAQIFGIEQVNEVSTDGGSAARDATVADAAQLVESSTDVGQDSTATPDSGSTLDAADAGDAASPNDSGDSGDSGNSGDSGDASEAGVDCGPPSPLFPSTGTIYCPFPEAGTLNCTPAVEECCVGGSLPGGGYAPSVCAPFGSSCANGTGPAQYECQGPGQCVDGGVCCGTLAGIGPDSCGNLKGQITQMLCETACSLSENAICGSPLECDVGKQCLPLRSRGVSLGYCASSYFTVSPQTASFGTVDAGTTQSTQLLVGNGSPAAAVVDVAIGGGAGHVTITSTTCNKLVLASGSCTVDVTFAPTAPGDAAATLVVSSGGVPVATAALGGTAQ